MDRHRPYPYLVANPYIHRSGPVLRPRYGAGASSWSLWQSDGKSKKKSPPWCSLITVLLLFLIVLGVIAAAGLAFYMAALRLEPGHAHLIFDGSMRLLGDKYHINLSNKSSLGYKEKNRRYQTLLETIFGRSALGPSLEEVIITSFANGSLLVFFRIILDRRKIPKPLENLEEVSKNIILKEAASPASILNNLRLDSNQVYVKRYVEEAVKYYPKREEINYELKKGSTSMKSSEQKYVTSKEDRIEFPTLRVGSAGLHVGTKPNKPKSSSKIIKEDKIEEDEDLITTTVVTLVKKTEKKPDSILSGIKHSPALKQLLQQRNRASSSTTKKTTTTSPTTVTNVIPTTIPTRITTTEKSLDQIINKTRFPHLPVFTVDDEPWRPIFPGLENINKQQKYENLNAPIDFEVGVGEAEVVESTGDVKNKQKPKIKKDVEGPNFSQSLVKNRTMFEPFQFEEKKSMPSLSILEKFHNIDALLRNYPTTAPKRRQTTPSLVTLMPARSNSGGSSSTGGRRPLPTRDPRVPEDAVISSENVAVNDDIPIDEDQIKRYLKENLKDLAIVSTGNVDISTQRGVLRGLVLNNTENIWQRRKPKSRKKRSVENPLDREMKLLLEEIFHNLTTTVRTVRAGVKTTEIEFNLGPAPFPKTKFDINSTRLMLNKLAKLHISADDVDIRNTSTNYSDQLNNKAITSGHTSNGDGLKILTKIFNKAPVPLKQIVQAVAPSNSLNISECIGDICANGECVSSGARCNQLQDCSDGSDEAGCSCADFLRAQSHHNKICDTIVDCADYSDEYNCEWCWPGQYVCSSSRHCIDQSKVCDGYPNCPFGDDEKHCITIAPLLSAPTSKAYHSSGFLMVKKEGVWGKVCLQNFEDFISKSNLDWSLQGLGESVCKSMTFKKFESVNKLKEAEARSLSKSMVYFELAYTKNTTIPTARKSSARDDRLSFERTSCNEKEVLHVSCEDLECGIRPEANIPWANERRSRIVGGGNAGPGSWPWQAALYKEGEFQCGATLISDSWLLSAAHCFYHALDEYWVARLGVLRRGLSLRAPHEQIRPVDTILLHPSYKDTGFLNDLALLRTKTPLTLTSYVRPICLPPADSSPPHASLCTVVGWGQLFEMGRVFPETLQEVELPVISTAECRKRTLFLPLYRLTDNMFCAGYERGGRDACLGDSGGPLMCQDGNGRWVLTGVTSNGYGCARANRPGVYTKVVNYLDWVWSSMKDYKRGVGWRGTRDTCHGHRCPLGECLPPARLCNGYTECSDSSDEAGCN